MKERPGGAPFVVKGREFGDLAFLRNEPKEPEISPAASLKLLAVDLDGTLLTRDRSPHPRSLEALHRLQDSGVLVVLASGRIAPSMKPFAELVRAEYPIICSNGAHVMGRDGEELHHYSVDAHSRDRVLDYVLARNLHVNIYCRSELFFLGDSRWGDEYVRRVKTIQPSYISLEEARSIEPTKLMIVDEPEEIAGHAEYLNQFVKFRNARMTISEPEYLEVLNGQADKAIGLKAVAEHLGIERSQVGAIGDYLNDLEMVSWAGVSGAVGNADPAVKRAAQAVYSSNDEGGVADFVDSLGLNRRE